MQRRLLLLGMLFLLLGLFVFATPWWVPMISDARPEPEAFTISGRFGGGIIGIGVAIMIVSAFVKKN